MEHNLQCLIGKRIIGFRGRKCKGYAYVNLKYILFDDQETYIELAEQDRYDYHDYSCTAREIRVYLNKKLWQKMMNKEDGFEETDQFDLWY